MRSALLILGLAAFGLGFCGCGSSDAPRVDAEGKAAKAPEAPKDGP